MTYERTDSSSDKVFHHPLGLPRIIVKRPCRERPLTSTALDLDTHVVVIRHRVRLAVTVDLIRVIEAGRHVCVQILELAA